MKPLSLAATAFVVGLLATPGLAAAQLPTQDSVVGVAYGGSLLDFNLELDARSGPSGENPTGQVAIRSRGTGQVIITGPVTCLRVVTPPSNPFVRVAATLNFETVSLGVGTVTVTTGGRFPSAADVNFSGRAPTDCPDPLFNGGGRFDARDVVITDAPPLPTSKDRCKNGGWKTFGVFKNQGDCVSFVATGGKNPPANKPR